MTARVDRWLLRPIEVRVGAPVAARLSCDVADALGLTEGLSEAMAPTKRRRRGHDRGRVLVDLAVMLADGGTAISDLAGLHNQSVLFGDVASTPTAWRTVEAIDAPVLTAIASARAPARAGAWTMGPIPASMCRTSTTR